MKRLPLTIAFTTTLCASVVLAGPSSFRTAPLFTDNMVLQQQSEAPIWGTGTPGAVVTIRASWGDRAATSVRDDGSWMARVTTPAAGGPYEISLGHDDTSLVLRNVMIGEVWLCSGQSNMEMPLQGWPPGDTILGSAETIRNSAITGIRLFSVRRAFSASPESGCEGSWVESSPKTTPTFSATAYFFGKHLYDSLKVPVGLIHSSWGGTPIDSWMSAEYLSRIPRYDSTLQKLRQGRAGMRVLQEWLDRYPRLAVSKLNGPDEWKGLSFRDELCASAAFNDSAWREMQLPVAWERTSLGEFDGAVWFRKKVDIPREWLHQDLVLELGPIDDMDITFVNGAKVGSQEGEGFWNFDRSYRVPRKLVDTTVIEISVRVLDTQGGGGIWGEPKALALHPDGKEERIALAGTWKYLPVAELRGDGFYVFGAAGEPFWTRPHLPVELSAYLPTTLFNAMISPLLPYSIRGAIWYQGESNVDDPALYAQLMPLMIRNWRSAFQIPAMPFYYVQIAPFEYDKPAQSQFLREAQLRSLSLGNTGMAVTLDIGRAKNIHPPDKQEVGRRLALWALAKTYGRNDPFSGPLYRSMKREGGRIILSFDNAGKKLVLRKQPSGNGFQIAGDDRIFKDATVVVRGDRLIVSRGDIRIPQAVRYAFTNAPEATLFNAAGLPASSFRTDDWER